MEDQGAGFHRPSPFHCSFQLFFSLLFQFDSLLFSPFLFFSLLVGCLGSFFVCLSFFFCCHLCFFVYLFCRGFFKRILGFRFFPIWGNNIVSLVSWNTFVLFATPSSLVSSMTLFYFSCDLVAFAFHFVFRSYFCFFFFFLFFFLLFLLLLFHIHW